MPGDIADMLTCAGVPTELPIYVFERLPLDEERVQTGTIGDLAGNAGGDGPDDTPFSDLTVLVIERTVWTAW